MTPKFLKAIPYVLTHEGHISNEAFDAGGYTSYGISLLFLESIHDDVNHDGKVDANDIKGLTVDQAEQIYFDNFWKPIYEKLSDRIATKVFDVAVNTGNLRAALFLQKTAIALGQNITADGLLGDQTIMALSHYNDDQILDKYCDIQAQFYKDIVAKNPSQQKFENGWLNRASFKPA